MAEAVWLGKLMPGQRSSVSGAGLRVPSMDRGTEFSKWLRPQRWSSFFIA